MNPAERLFPKGSEQVADALLQASRIEATKESMRTLVKKNLSDAHFLVRLAREKIIEAASNLPIADDSSAQRIDEILNAAAALQSQLASTNIVLGR